MVGIGGGWVEDARINCDQNNIVPCFCRWLVCLGEEFLTVVADGFTFL